MAGACEVPAGATKTCSFDISSYNDRNKTLSVVIANYAKGYTGTILYDNFKAGDQVLWDFNEDKYDAFARAAKNTEEMIPEIKIVFEGGSTTRLAQSQNLGARAFSLNGNVLSLAVARPTDATVELFDVQGHKVATLYKGTLSSGTHSMKVRAAKGVYLLKVSGNDLRFSQKMIIK